MSYREHLLDEGVAGSRVDGLCTAMDVMHSELCKLDNHNLALIVDHGGVLGNLEAFAKKNGVRDIAKEMYLIALHNAAERIDFEDGFDEMSDRLYYAIEDAAKINIPGARMLTRAIRDLRRMHEREKAKELPLYTRVAKQVALNLEEYREPNYNLEIRNTFKYVGEYRHLDDWTIMGNVQVAHRREGRSNSYESGTSVIMVMVTSEFDDCDVAHALKDTFSYSGCSHEWDCCGCLSQSVRHVRKLYDDIWFLKVSWHRNV